VRPETNLEFLRLTVDATLTTAAYAVLGTVVSVVIGVVGGTAVAERPWESPSAAPMRRVFDRVMRWTTRLAFVVPRAVHEVVWALLLVQILGFDPLVAVIAIAIQFGAVTAKVYGDAIDDADSHAFRTLRAAGAARLTALWYGIVPQVRDEFVSYGFYRLECAVRAAAVLGIVGAGGLGFQLDLSFESLRYDEMWTLIAALMVLSGGADWWSSKVRRAATPTAVRRSWIAVAVMVPLAWWHIELDPTTLWSPRTRQRFVEVVGDLFPPRLGPGGWSELWEASVDTLAMSVLATVLAATTALVLAVFTSRPGPHRRAPVRRAAAWTLRAAFLLTRAVPAPVWAFLVVLIMFPGIWPGAVALGIYNLGVLGRLFTEVFEDHDDRSRRLLEASGAGHVEQFAYAVVPVTATRLISLALYRWEVITRETVIVGVVGAAGLGRLFQEHLVARDFAAVTGSIGALVALTVMVDTTSRALRRQFG